MSPEEPGDGRASFECGSDAMSSRVRVAVQRGRSPPVACAPCQTCLVGRDVPRTANPHRTTAAAGRQTDDAAHGPSEVRARRPSDTLRAPFGETTEARWTARQNLTMTRRLYRRGGNDRPADMWSPDWTPLWRPTGEVPTLPVLSPFVGMRPTCPMYGVRCDGRKVLRRRLPAAQGRKYWSNRRGPITRPAAASPPHAAYRRRFAVPRLATGWLAGRMEGHRDGGRGCSRKGKPRRATSLTRWQRRLRATDAPTEQGLEDGRSRKTGCNLQRQEGNGRR